MTDIDKLYNLMSQIIANYTAPGRPRKEAEKKMREVRRLLDEIAKENKQ